MRSVHFQAGFFVAILMYIKYNGAMKKFLTIPAAFLILGCTLSAGCAKNYSFYTNIPDGGYEITDSHFTLGGTAGGYSATEPEIEEIDTTGYTSKSKSYYSMLSPAELVVSADFSADGAESRFNEFTAVVGATLDNIDKCLSHAVENSDITKFNNAQAGEEIEIRRITYEVLSEAYAVYKLTEGYYNPALYYNVRAYYFGDKQVYPKRVSQLPSDEEVAVYTDLASHFGDIVLRTDGDKYFIKKPDYTVSYANTVYSMKLDLGGIGKGYAVDRVEGLFDEYGYKFGYFNFGASSMLVKSNVQSGDYNLYFASPRATSTESYGYVKIKTRNQKISTSGDNEKYYTINGVRYCHVIDPTTGKPVNKGIMSVTIIGGSAGSADALTTAVMAMGRDKALQFIESKLTDRKVVFSCE